MLPIALGFNAADEFGAVLRSLAGPYVRVGARVIADADVARLYNVERRAIRSAGPKRRREFATGRALLRQVAGIDDAIPVGADRRPVLPEGVVASLAHDDRIAIAAAASPNDVIAIGVDICGMMDRLSCDVAELILRPDDDVSDPMLAFALKEATYKAWTAMGNGWLDHHDIRLRLTGTAFTADVGNTSLSGHYAACGSSWLALVAVERDESAPATSTSSREC